MCRFKTLDLADVADVAAGASALASVAANWRKVLRLTDESVAVLEKLGKIPDGAWASHAFVMDGSKIKAQLRFTTSSVKPQPLGSLQTAAATMVLRARRSRRTGSRCQGRGQGRRGGSVCEGRP